MIDTQAILEELKLEKGRPPMRPGQLRRRIQAYTESKWPWSDREQDPAGYLKWKTDMLPTLAEAEAAFAFNHRLANYRAAVARLSRYRLADGRPELFEDQPTGETDPETGEPVLESVLVQAGVEQLPATIEQDIRDPETGEVTGTDDVPNPAIVLDDEERAAAQAVIDGTSLEVAEFIQGEGR